MNAELVDEQLRLARRYRNQLLQLELERRGKYREIMRTHGDIASVEDQIAGLDARLEELREHINTSRKSARSRVPQPTASTDAKAIRAELKVLRDEARTIRKRVKDDPAIQAQLEALEEAMREKHKALRASCGVYWGTYLTVENAIDQMRKSKTDPRFSRWNGEGRVAVQIQGGATIADITSGRCSLLQIDPLPTTQWDTRSGCRAAKTVARIRVQSGEKGSPVWAHFPVLLHRPLPADGVVKNAWVVRRYVARKPVWQLQIVIEGESLAREAVPASAPVAAINFGWRVRPEGLRVGMLVDEHGSSQEILLPQRFLEKLDHADSLQAIRDRNLEEFRPRLTAALKALADSEQLPPWFAPEDLATIALWRSSERFSRFIVSWKEQRTAALELITTAGAAPTEPDREIFRDAEEWRRQDLHLLQWAVHEREKALGWRRDMYRVLASQLGTRYSLIVTDAFDLRKVARTAAPESEEDPKAAAQRRNRHRASIGMLRMTIKSRCKMAEVDSANATHECSSCGAPNSFDASVHLVHVCTACNAEWDQDANAALNFLKRYRERPADDTSAA